VVWAIFTFGVLLGVGVLASRAGHFFATAQKSTQKRPPLPLRPCKKHRGPHRFNAVIMLWKRRSCASCARDISASMHVNSQKTLRQFSQKAHDNGTASMACGGGRKVKVTSKTGATVYLMNLNMHPECFSRGRQVGMAFFWLLFFCYWLNLFGTNLNELCSAWRVNNRDVIHKEK